MSEAARHDDSTLRLRAKSVFLAFALIGGFFLLAEYRAHVLPWLPWLFLAACPLMHLFMHHGHRRPDHPGGPGASRRGPSADTTPGSATPAGQSGGVPQSTRGDHE